MPFFIANIARSIRAESRLRRPGAAPESLRGRPKIKLASRQHHPRVSFQMVSAQARVYRPSLTEGSVETPPEPCTTRGTFFSGS